MYASDCSNIAAGCKIPHVLASGFFSDDPEGEGEVAEHAACSNSACHVLLPAATMLDGTLAALDMLCCAALVLPSCSSLSDMRAMMQWLVAAQEPDSQERRAAQATRRYCYVGGSWQLVRELAGTAAAVTEAAAEAATAAAVL